MERTDIKQWHEKCKEIDGCRDYYTEVSGKYRIDTYGKDFDGLINDVTEKHGMENLKTVIAATIRSRSHDGRISADAKDWADGYDKFPEPPPDVPITMKQLAARFHVPEHSCDIDIVAKKLIDTEKTASMNQTVLTNKIDDEYARFKEQVVQLPPDQIFDNAYEISCKTEIYNYLMHDKTFSEDEVDTLLDHNADVLDGVYGNWLKLDTEYNLNATIEQCLEVYTDRAREDEDTVEVTVRTEISEDMEM